MNTADAASCEHFDTRTMSDPTGRGDCRCAVPTFGDGNRKITRADFSNAVFVGEFAYFSRAETGFQFPGENSNGGGYRPGIANDLFETLRGFEVYRSGQTVRDDRRLECDY